MVPHPAPIAIRTEPAGIHPSPHWSRVMMTGEERLQKMLALKRRPATATVSTSSGTDDTTLTDGELNRIRVQGMYAMVCWG